MKMSKNLGLPLLAVGGALAWWWWKERAPATGGKDPAAVDADKGVQIGQAGSNIGLTGDQVGSLMDKLLDQTAPYDEIRYVKDEQNNRHRWQVKYRGQGDWVTVQDNPELTPLKPRDQIIAELGLKIRG